MKYLHLIQDKIVIRGLHYSGHSKQIFVIATVKTWKALWKFGS